MCIWVVKSSALADLIPSLFLCKWLSGLTTESSILSNGKFAVNGRPSGELSAERSISNHWAANTAGKIPHVWNTQKPIIFLENIWCSPL